VALAVLAEPMAAPMLLMAIQAETMVAVLVRISYLALALCELFGQEQLAHSQVQEQEIYNGTFYSHKRWSTF
jgi:hypothetical protein